MQTMIRPLKNNLEVLQFPGLAGNCNISHFITTRQGGVSTGAYAQMNPGLYTDDCPDSIRKNREILAEGIQLPVQNIITPHQTHQDRIIHIPTASPSCCMLPIQKPLQPFMPVGEVQSYK